MGINFPKTSYSNEYLKTYTIIMRKDGYYYVKFQGDNYIARYVGGAWSLAGNINIYYDEDFEYIDDKNCFMFL